MKKITYDTKEKKYYLPPIYKYNFSKIETIIILIISTIFIIISSYQLINTLNINSNQKYNEQGKIDYKVYLKENDYYNNIYLEKGMNYVASLINNINIELKYEVDSDIKINYNSIYSITNTLYITEKSTGNILYKKDEIVKEITKYKNTNNDMYIIEEIDINYDHYNDIVNNFKKEYSLSTESYIIVQMNINNQLSSKDIKTINNQNNLKVMIPLSEQTVNISLNEESLNNENIFEKTKYINNITKFIIYILLILINIAVIFYILLKYFFKRKDIYYQEIKKYLKKYNSIIVNAKQPNLDETKFKEIIRIITIEELIDLQNSTEKPIIFYEVIEAHKSYFIIIDSKTLYKFTITRAYLDRAQKNKKAK